MLDSQFWPTVATVLPVLALALVIEARASISRWTDDYPPRWLRTIQGFLWIVPIAFFAYIEPVAFQALEGTKPSHFAVSLVVPTVGLSLGVLVVNPGVELLIRANARVVAKATVFIASIPQRRRARKILRQARKNLRTVKKGREMQLVNSAELYSLAARINSSDDTALKREIQTALAQLREEIDASRKDSRELEQEIRDTLSEAVENRAKAKLGILTPEEMAKLESAITQMDFRARDVEKSAKEDTSADILES